MGLKLREMEAAECPWQQSHQQELLGSVDLPGFDRLCSGAPLKVTRRKIKNSFDSSTSEQDEVLRVFWWTSRGSANSVTPVQHAESLNMKPRPTATA
jgi:hypothetical protein